MLLPLVKVVVAVAMVVVVPWGLRLVGGADVDQVRRVWLVPAAVAAVAFWLPRGVVPTLLCVPYAVLTVALAVIAARRALAVLPGVPTPVQVATWTALATPSIAALALLAERRGVELFGFDLEILALTVAHFHVAGFAAALVAALVARAAPGRLATAAALCVPGGTLVVLVGFFVGDEVELVGAAVLTAGMWAAGWLTWHEVRPGRDVTTRRLLGTSAVVLVATMALALSYAVGEAFDLPHLSHTWMAATHGVANVLGFAVCGLLAWRRMEPQPL